MGRLASRLASLISFRPLTCKVLVNEFIKLYIRQSSGGFLGVGNHGVARWSCHPRVWWNSFGWLVLNLPPFPAPSPWSPVLARALGSSVTALTACVLASATSFSSTSSSSSTPSSSSFSSSTSVFFRPPELHRLQPRCRARSGLPLGASPHAARFISLLPAHFEDIASVPVHVLGSSGLPLPRM